MDMLDRGGVTVVRDIGPDLVAKGHLIHFRLFIDSKMSRLSIRLAIIFIVGVLPN
jgi:hypothetical protein